MNVRAGATPNPVAVDDPAESSWKLVVDAARLTGELALRNDEACFAATASGHLRQVPFGTPGSVLAWRPPAGWDLLLSPDDPRHAPIDLYLPVCSATPARPITVGHLGQSLDGFIATHSGDSQFVTGPQNIVHLHRMRALCDAIVVGAGTVAADDPLLTTRHVAGPNPIRVVLDPARRLNEQYRVFSDGLVETLYVCARSLVADGESQFGQAIVVPVDDTPGGLDVTAVLALLRARDCHRIFVEGGGVTVSMFLEANQLDRLQVAIAPLIIGEGRPAIRLAPPDAISECWRPNYRVFRMGGDVFFDCDLRSRSESATVDALSPVIRVI